jgi:hypothetical protein
MGRAVATVLPLWVLIAAGTGRAQSEPPVTDKVGEKARNDKGTAPAAEATRAAPATEKGKPAPAAQASKTAAPATPPPAKPAKEEAKVEAKAEAEAKAEVGPRAYKDEALTLDKRLARLRDQTNELGTVSVQDRAAPIPTAERMDRQEIGVPKAEPTLDRPDSVPELDAQAKERWFGTPEWRGRFGELRRCPGEVARRRSVRPSSVPAGAVLLRWTTDELGRVREAAVVGTGERVDPDVMSCVHRKMAQWRLDAPPATVFRTDWTVDLRP